MILAGLVLTQEKKTKGKGKVYSMHAPEVECIAKGKAHNPYEFGVKTTLATTAWGGFALGARSLPGNPYDGHTLAEQLDQVVKLTGMMPKRCHVDVDCSTTITRPHRIASLEMILPGLCCLS